MRLLRLVFVIRLAITLALTLGVLAMSSTPSFSYPGFAKDKHGHNGKSENHGKNHKDKNKGKHEDSGKHKGKDKGKKNKKDKRVKAEPLAAYTVHAECSYEPASDQTTCDFDADSPPGGKKINLLDLPSDEICAPVVGGDARYVDPDPNTGATGYRSTDPDGKFTLVFSGHVTASGSATYWIKAASDIFPATGMGLSCEPGEASVPQTTTPSAAVPTATAVAVTPEVTDTTGSVVVQAYTCPIATAPADYDWYGQCTPLPAGSRYRLMRLDSATRDAVTTSTDSSGRVTFRSLPPGTYQLTQAEGDWCHAQSDDVNADGNLIVKAGARTSVWVFTCAGAP